MLVSIFVIMQPDFNKTVWGQVVTTPSLRTRLSERIGVGNATVFWWLRRSGLIAT